MIWAVLGILYIVNVGFIAWLLYTAPTMPDDYGLNEEDIWPADEWPDLLDDEEDGDHVLDLDNKTLNELVDEQYANEKNKRGI
tara:strand:- start:48 stop:296 length:249 start_codon:yes stop_codon:yes gene_type:complete